MKKKNKKAEKGEKTNTQGEEVKLNNTIVNNNGSKKWKFIVK